jgi:hypothetical protein
MKIWLITQAFLVAYGQQIPHEQLSFVQSAKVIRLAMDGSKPLKLRLAKTWPQFIRANIKWLAIRKPPHG